MGMYCLAWLNANKLGISHFFIWIALKLFLHTDERKIKKFVYDFFYLLGVRIVTNSSAAVG
jgi:hypothetical protein